MSKRWLAVCALVCGLLLTSSLMAAPPQGQGKSKNKPEPSAIKDKDKGKSHDVAKDDKGKDAKDKSKGKDNKDNKAKDDDKWERKGGFETRMYGANEGNPPGWSRGKKTGWDNCGVPPGQAKQGDCRTYRHQGRRYYYYRDEQGRVVVRRPEITIQTR